jgi:PAS domain S-box-containing protein
MSTPPGSSLPLILVAHRLRDTVELIKALLEDEGFTVLCAYNGRAALQYTRQHHPALLLLDQALPLLDGLQLCRTLRQEEQSPAIFVLSDRPDELGRLLAFAAGADDCVTLPFPPRELLARVKAILRRTPQPTASNRRVLHCGQLELDLDQHQARIAGQVIPLTSLEYELLSTLLRHPGRAFSREQLLELLPGFQRSTPLDRAVDIHISNLRRKLRQAGGNDAVSIETVRGVGYRLNMPATQTAQEAPAVDTSQGQLALAAFERAPVPLLVLAPDRTVILYNEAARRLCGWSAEQVVGQTRCYSLLLCHRPDGTMLCHEDCILHQVQLNRLADQTAQYTITLKDGREIPVVAHYSSLGEPGAGYTLLTLDPDFTRTQLP